MKITFGALPAQGKKSRKCLRFRDILTNTRSFGAAQCGPRQYSLLRLLARRSV